MNLKKRMSALLGRTDRHDAPAAHPRISRLNKAALLFLVAASAAFFVCAQAGALPVVKEPPIFNPPIKEPIQKIQIVKMGPYSPLSSDAIEGERHTVYVSTNMPFRRVKWYVNGDLKKTYTNTPPTSNTESRFDYEYKGLGSTDGNSVTIRAVATGWIDVTGSASKEMTITVWDPIRINYISRPRRYVEGETIQLSARTNIPYSSVDFYVNGTHAGTARNNGQVRNYASISHTLGNEARGSQAGSKYAISATAYATVAGRQTSSDKTGKITVFADKGYIWKATSAEVISFSATDVEHQYVLTTWHSVHYYNDTGKVPEETVRTKNAWRIGHDKNAPLEDHTDKDESEDPQPVLIEYGLTETLAYAASMGFYRSRMITLEKGKWYGGHAYTNLHSDGQSQCKGESSPLALEYDDEKQLPSGGSDSKTNLKPEAKFLFE